MGERQAQEVINIYGRSAGNSRRIRNIAASASESGVYGDFTSDQAGPRQNVGASAWGAMSDNVWGTFADNVWGTVERHRLGRQQQRRLGRHRRQSAVETLQKP